jgi:hypothetical protein
MPSFEPILHRRTYHSLQQSLDQHIENLRLISAHREYRNMNTYCRHILYLPIGRVDGVEALRKAKRKNA